MVYRVKHTGFTIYRLYTHTHMDICKMDGMYYTSTSWIGKILSVTLIYRSAKDFQLWSWFFTMFLPLWCLGLLALQQIKLLNVWDFYYANDAKQESHFAVQISTCQNSTVCNQFQESSGNQVYMDDEVFRIGFLPWFNPDSCYRFMTDSFWLW